MFDEVSFEFHFGCRLDSLSLTCFFISDVQCRTLSKISTAHVQEFVFARYQVSPIDISLWLVLHQGLGVGLLKVQLIGQQRHMVVSCPITDLNVETWALWWLRSRKNRCFSFTVPVNKIFSILVPAGHH